MIDIGRQMTARIRAWREELGNHMFRPCAGMPWEYFTTFARLSPQEASQGSFVPAAPGTAWGERWQYAWFRGSITLPQEAEGERVVLFPGGDGEMLVWVNGEERGSLDREHPYLTLARSAKAGQRFDILAEVYAGHGPAPENIGPVPPERPPHGETPELQRTARDAVVAIWNEDAYQLRMDVETLWSLLQVLPPRSLRAMRVAKALEDFTFTADFELDAAGRRESFCRAREALAPALRCNNGTTAPIMSLIGQSHIDLAWRWTHEETRRKCARTYSNQLALMEEYPEYLFWLCEPPLLETLRLEYPALYARVQQKVQQGRIISEGAFWVESDTNMPSGEGLIRQLLWGKKWYREECGVDSKIAWLPDSFGFSAVLPQIFRGCGIPYFSSQKLFRADPETQPFPYNDFVWEGMDGSTVLANMHFKNNAEVTPLQLAERWDKHHVQKTETTGGMLYPFGYGDGGGGADRDMLEMVRRVADLEGIPRATLQNPLAYFAMLENNPPQNRWVGELYLAWHRGTYTAQVETKQAYRRAEIALREAEIWGTLAFAAGAPYPAAPMEEAWRTVLFNQFHDVLAGVGMEAVHRQAEKQLGECAAACGRLAEKGAQNLAAPVAQAGMVTLFNSLSWQREGWVALPGHVGRAVTAEGKELPVTQIGKRCEVYVSLPPMGWQSLRLYKQPLPNAAPPLVACMPQPEGGFTLENGLVRLTVNACGEVVSLVDCENGMETLAGPSNRFCLYGDLNPDYDAWEIAREYHRAAVELSGKAELSLESCTPHSVVVLVRKTLGRSRLQQRIILRAHSRRVDFETSIDWQERHKMLKVEFQTNLLAENALHEIQFGYIERPAHASHPFAQDRYEVCNHRYSALAETGRGLALLNNGSYGISSGRGSLALTLLRAPMAPDATADLGQHHFTYSLLAYCGAFAQSDVPQQGYGLNTPVPVLAGAADTRSLFSVSVPGVLLETVKPAEDGSGDIILRLYESRRALTACTLHTLLPVAECRETDMLETPSRRLECGGGTIALQLRPFEIKTLRLRLQK